jgi:hypothetical protein
MREEASVYKIEATIDSETPIAHTIDWLENVGSGYYHWPNLIVDKTETIKTRAFGRQEGALTLTEKDKITSAGHSAIRLSVDGVEFYLCSSRHGRLDGQSKPGYILYLGAPGEDIRHKIRTVLSFTIGIYLVYLGSATYSAEDRLLSFKAIKAYSMDNRAFELPTMPPAFLGQRAHNELTTVPVSRMVNALYSYYDRLQFGNLSWAYWHALCAPLHIAAVHFGAAIEALQRRYIETKGFRTKILAPAKWTEFNHAVDAAIDAFDMLPEQREVMKENTGLLNRVSRRIITEKVIRQIGILVGDDEKRAWQRRHDAAHGNDTKPGSEPEMIRDMKLLKVLFHRMLLKIVNGSDLYYDYASLDFPLRPLAEPIPPIES